MPLNEAERRRANFRGGAEVEMADGQVWHLAKPAVCFRRDSGGSGTAVKLTLPGSDCDFQALMDRVDACHEFNARLNGLTEEQRDEEYRAHPGMNLAAAELDVAHALLAANYELDPAEADALVVFCYQEDGDPAAYQRRRDVMAVANGLAPKPRAGGSSSA